MPHLVIDYTDNLHQLQPDVLLRHCNAALAQSGHFEEADIKSRCVRLETYLIGTAATTPRGFVHAKLAVLSGRSEAVKQGLSALLLQVLEAECTRQMDLELQLCVEIQDIDRSAYAKAV